ncbi:MAG: 16S rRNA (guanine(527)-N(7))-methyltransferase RsmG [Lachnospiraceae bacterium]|nr:16S rRNA (guanine(527)-N(7))-methyltransferase RsmG [Lachnospiraceae bacterium]
MSNIEYLRDQFLKLNIDLTEEQCDQFMRFYDMLIEKNTVMNLTNITEYIDVVEKHFLDSVCIKLLEGDFLDPSLHYKVLDMGTGAGFPGIPLSIIYSTWNITLTDSLNKRVSFLNEVTNELGLMNVNAIHSRAEDLGRDKNHREKYDLVLSRAVARLSVLSEYTLPFIKPGGYFIAYKSGDIESEIKEGQTAVKKLGGSFEDTFYFTLPGTDINRSFVIIKKKKNTPDLYPRKAGTPTKNPL